MKQKTLIRLWAAICSLIVSANLAFSQGTAFTYQGRLDRAGSPVTGLYDFTNALYNASSGGAQAGATVTLTAVPVTNGLFTVLLDFGGVFNGTTYWLQIGVRSNGVGSYAALSPRQELTPTPYAVTAENVNGLVSASQLTGTLPSGLLSGAYGNAVNLNNAGNSFSGNGAGLTGLNASSLGSGTVSDARLSPNVALLNSSQTFLKTNVFASGGGAGRLVVSNLFTAVDTNLFTGLSFQYDATFGEGALMSSFNDGTAYLSFYTKAGGGSPITKQMIIDRFGGVAIDQGNYNDGSLNQSSTNSAGLTFGVGSGEGIASKRTAGGNQWGLDFYTSFANRMSIANNGFVGIGRQTPITGADTFAVRSPAPTGTYGGMYVDTAGTNALPFYGYAMNGSAIAWTFLDGSDANKWEVYNNGIQLTVTPTGTVGIGTTTPEAKLDVRGDVKMGAAGQYFATGGAENLRIVRGIVTPSGGIYDGTGFTVTNTSTGTYKITFNPAFADTPSLTITPYTSTGPATADCTGGTSSGFSTISTWVSGAKANNWWNFTAIGAR